MTLPTACCTLPPVESNYQPKGSIAQLDDLSIYEVGDAKREQLLICFYDIFGFHPVTKQFCDKLSGSKHGFRVVMPDFFRGSPFPQENFPPKDMQIIMDWIGNAGSWEKIIKGDFAKLLQHYKSQGVKKIGIFGFCWGAKMCVDASIDFPNDIQASTLIHPSLVKDEDGEKVNCPFLLLPTKDDSDMLPFYEKVKVRFGESGHYRFEDIFHGFASARGDMDNELNRIRLDEALNMTHNFFSKLVK